MDVNKVTPVFVEDTTRVIEGDKEKNELSGVTNSLRQDVTDIKITEVNRNDWSHEIRFKYMGQEQLIRVKYERMEDGELRPYRGTYQLKHDESGENPRYPFFGVYSGVSGVDAGIEYAPEKIDPTTIEFEERDGMTYRVQDGSVQVVIQDKVVRTLGLNYWYKAKIARITNGNGNVYAFKENIYNRKINSDNTVEFNSSLNISGYTETLDDPVFEMEDPNLITELTDSENGRYLTVKNQDGKEMHKYLVSYYKDEFRPWISEIVDYNNRIKVESESIQVEDSSVRIYKFYSYKPLSDTAEFVYKGFEVEGNDIETTVKKVDADEWNYEVTASCCGATKKYYLKYERLALDLYRIDEIGNEVSEITVGDSVYLEENGDETKIYCCTGCNDELGESAKFSFSGKKITEYGSSTGPIEEVEVVSVQKVEKEGWNYEINVSFEGLNFTFLLKFTKVKKNLEIAYSEILQEYDLGIKDEEGKEVYIYFISGFEQELSVDQLYDRKIFEALESDKNGNYGWIPASGAKVVSLKKVENEKWNYEATVSYNGDTYIFFLWYFKLYYDESYYSTYKQYKVGAGKEYYNYYHIHSDGEYGNGYGYRNDDDIWLGLSDEIGYPLYFTNKGSFKKELEKDSISMKARYDTDVKIDSFEKLDMDLGEGIIPYKINNNYFYITLKE